MPSKTVTIGLLWHSMTSDNLGVGALTIGHIALLREAAAHAGVTPRFVVLGWDEERQPYFSAPDISIEPLRLRHFIAPSGGLLDAIKACDLVLDIGAGDSFSDIYGAGRILKMIAAQNLVRVAGRPLIMSPQTLGPFEQPTIKRMAISVLNSAALVAARDDLSVNYAREIGYDGPLIQASDVALRLPYNQPAPRGDGTIKVGINISGLLFKGGYSGDNMFGLKGNYADLMRDVIRFFRTAKYVDLHLVSHVVGDRLSTGGVEDDREAAKQLAEEFPGVHVAPSFRSPIDAKSYIADMDFFVGARMHACIAAFSSGVPVVPIAYSRKFEGLFGALGYDMVADCRAEHPDAILARIKLAFAQRTEVRTRMREAFEAGLQRLDIYSTAIVRQLEDASRRKQQAA
ncbi:MAG: polysaccharide pyruvyl transferase family protein [Pseudomonadota bacterium]